jgi:hypothetical protein
MIYASLASQRLENVPVLPPVQRAKQNPMWVDCGTPSHFLRDWRGELRDTPERLTRA